MPQLSLLEETSAHDPGGKIRLRVPTHWESSAEFSSCERYRYKLMRVWDASKPLVMYLLMNPSVASVQFSDPTVAKCCRISQRLGFGGLYIANSCAYRSTSPKGLLNIPDPVGPRNIEAILEMAKQCDSVVVAHGKLPGKLQQHADGMCAALLDAGHNLHVLKLGNKGIPCHPLFLPEALTPVLWKTALNKTAPPVE